MGTYIYRIVAKPIVAIDSNSNVIETHPLSFFYKVGCENRYTRLQEGRINNYWLKRGFPKSIAIGDIKQASVLSYYKNNGCISDDTFSNFIKTGEIQNGQYIPWWNISVYFDDLEQKRETFNDLIGNHQIRYTRRVTLNSREIINIQGNDQRMCILLKLLFDKIADEPLFDS